MRPVIVHLATQRGIHSFRNTKRRGQEIGFPITTVRYEDLAERRTWPRGMYLFTDMERATPWQCSLAAQLWNKLAQRPDAFRLYNHPLEVRRRYELLRALYEDGTNDFNAYRLTELPGKVRYPVFLRYADQHIGPSTGLLHDQSELEAALAQLLIEGHPPERLIVVEFCDVSCGTGAFTKYSAFRLGDTVYTGHMMASREWAVKRENNAPELVAGREVGFIASNPHEAQVRRAFDVAGLSWGRIDYGVLDGRIQVWEINDNPKLGSSLFRQTLGRKKARVVSRGARRAVFAGEMAKVEPGESMDFLVRPSELATALQEAHARAVEQDLARSWV